LPAHQKNPLHLENPSLNTVQKSRTVHKSANYFVDDTLAPYICPFREVTPSTLKRVVGEVARQPAVTL
jgi:hypothetical protein